MNLLKDKYSVLFIIFALISFICVAFMIKISNQPIIEQPIAEPIKITYQADLPLGGAARLLAHDKNYDQYLEDDLDLISKYIIEDEPIEEWVEKHLKMVNGIYLNARVSPNIDDDHNIYSVLSPYEEIMVVGKLGDDWYMIEYDDEILYVASEFVTDVNRTLYSYDGTKLTASRGRIQGPSGSETYYNMDMSGIVSRLIQNGYVGDYYIRDDGCKMFGDYIMVAANFDIHPFGSIIETSLGLAIVCDTGEYVKWDPTGIDIATNW